MTASASHPKRPRLVAVAVGISLLGDTALYAILPVAFETLGLAPIHVGILLSANRWIRLASNAFAARLNLSVRPKAQLAAALLAGSLVCAGYAAAPSFTLLLLMRLVWGVAWSSIRHVGVMASSGSGRSLGFYFASTQAGFCAGFVLGGFLFDTVGFSASFLALAVASLAAVPLGVVGAPAERGEPRRRVADLRGVRRVGLLVRGMVTAFVGPGLVMSTLGYVLRENLGDTVAFGAVAVGVATLNGALLGLRYLLNIVSASALGRAVDRLGGRRIQVILYPAAAVFMALALVVDSSAVLLACLVGFLIVSAGISVALLAEASQASDREYALFATAGDLGSSLGPLIGWTAVELASSPVAVFGAGAALYVLCWFLALRYARGRSSA